MKYVLIIWFSWHGVATGEFNSKVTCEDAGKAAHEQHGGLQYVCVTK